MVLLSKQPTPRSSDGRMLLSPRVQTSRLAAIELPSDASRPLVPSDMPLEYLEHAARLRKLSASHAHEEAERRAASLAIADRQRSRRSKNPNKDPKPLRSRAQVVGMAGILSAAADCAAVLQAQLEPSVFARRTSAMTPDAMEAWLGAFGTCIAKLGGTLQDLHGQLQRQRASTKRHAIMESARHVVDKVEALELAHESLHEGTLAELSTTLAQQEGALLQATDHLLTKPKRRARLWTRALLAALTATVREERTLHEAMATLGLAAESLGACSDAICTYTCALLGCEHASLYVTLVQGGKEGGGKEATYRLRAPSPSTEEVGLCNVRIHGADAVAVKEGASLPAACLDETARGGGRILRVPEGYMDPRYNGTSDRIAGEPHPSSMLYLNLSDEDGPLRAVLRVAHHFDAPTEQFAPPDEAKLLQLAPVFALSLRHAARRAAAEPAAVQRAQVVESLGGCIGGIAAAGKTGDLGAIKAEFAHRICLLLEAEGAILYLYDEAAAKLVSLPADSEVEPQVVSYAPDPDGPHTSGIAGLCAQTRQTYMTKHVDDPRLATTDGPLGAGADYQISSAIATPIDSVATGAMIGVCVVTNRRGRDGPVPFDEEDESRLYAILRVTALAIENWQLHTNNSTFRAGLVRKMSVAS